MRSASLEDDLLMEVLFKIIAPIRCLLIVEDGTKLVKANNFVTTLSKT